MRILVELPDLIEDTVMITPALENLFKHHRDANFTFVGSSISAEFFRNDKRINKLIIEDCNNSIFSLISLFRTARSLGEQDLVVSFKNSFYSKFFLYFVNAKKKENFIECNKELHKVEKYNEFINEVLDSSYKAGDLMLRFKPQWFKKPTLGIHPGSTYADVKRWNSEEFTKVAKELSSKYEIVLLGAKKEKDICSNIEEQLKQEGISCTNLAGKTSISDLVEKIAALDLFITIDCGPMQIAAVYKVNTIVLPTSYEQIELRNQWKNPLQTIVYKEDDLYSEDESLEVKAQDVLKLFNL